MNEGEAELCCRAVGKVVAITILEATEMLGRLEWHEAPVLWASWVVAELLHMLPSFPRPHAMATATALALALALALISKTSDPWWYSEHFGRQNTKDEQRIGRPSGFDVEGRKAQSLGLW